MNRKREVSFRFIMALYTGKLLQLVSNILYKDRGTHTPGKLAFKICPDFLDRIGRPKIIIAVTGTNGKTSTANFINGILNNNGITTVNNSKGSNMPAGIASSLIANSDMLGRINKDVAVLEVDERASAFVYDHIIPTYLVCTNLFRDSIKRNGHSEFILTKIKSSIPSNTILILNADDLISSGIGGEKSRKVFFAINKLKSENEFNNIVCDVMTCPKCKSLLKFKYRHYHHIGSVYCSKCDFKSIDADFIVSDVDFNKMTFTLKEREHTVKYKLLSDSIFNVYNMLSAITTLRTFGLSHEQIRFGLENQSLKRDRYEINRTSNIEFTTMLSKDQNPISCSRMFDYVANQPGNKTIVLMITDSKDKIHGSEDISWLYDTDFEYLNTKDIKQIIACGTRCYDVSLRLKLAGIKENIIKSVSDYNEVENAIDLKDTDKVFILYELYAYPLASELKKRLMEKVGRIK